MPRFSTKDVLLATSLIAIGCWLFYWLGITGPRPLPFLVILALFLCIGPLIGSGVGAVFHRKKKGAAWGLVAQLVVWFSLLALRWIT
jgi:hypothetical protein